VSIIIPREFINLRYKEFRNSSEIKNKSTFNHYSASQNEKSVLEKYKDCIYKSTKQTVKKIADRKNCTIKYFETTTHFTQI